MRVIGSLPSSSGDMQKVSVISNYAQFMQNSLTPDDTQWWDYYQHGKTYTNAINTLYTLVNVSGKGGFVGFLSMECAADRIEGDLIITLDGVEETIELYGESTNENTKRFYYGYLSLNAANIRSIPCTRAAFSNGLCDKFESSLLVQFRPRFNTTINVQKFASGAFYHLENEGIQS
ncbi:hypothetical protein [Thalassotalea castellviae]|uniref:Uncharacterized protein n=1 Tax=Thalassotalea castellviae TaxID=3075612 RepID=A0ABU2ZZX9_9GAMM|nr:hypothetical protein [Thalassotalea sp. W431]MDT0603486.1 hypothetical protein [Thalassotalea sp. W431]